LLDAINDKGCGDEEFEDGRVTKERFQKIQLMETMTLIFTVASSGLGFMSVKNPKSKIQKIPIEIIQSKIPSTPKALYKIFP